MENRQPRFSNLLKLPAASRVIPVLEAALAAVDPYRAVKRQLQTQADILRVAGREFNLPAGARIFLVSLGKAACPMAQAVEDGLGEKLTAGIAVTKQGFCEESPLALQPLRRTQVFEAGHPIPDRRGLAASRKTADLLAQVQAEDLVICLISGGGSALLTDPIEGIDLSDLQRLTQLILRSGAAIHELNALRKHLERFKGGGLARAVSPAALATLILSDVVGDPLDVIASGPTVPDSSTYADCLSVLEKYDLIEQTPDSIIQALTRGTAGGLPETPKPGDMIFQNASTQIIGNNYTAAQAGLDEAEKQGFRSLLLTSSLDGEARQAGRMVAAVGQQVRRSGQPVACPACLAVGGETTVTVLGDGRGGRNLELALGAVEKLAGMDDVLLISLATDGEDGTTDAAGAFVTGETLDRGLQLGIHPNEFLARNDSYAYFEPLQALIKTGPTQTNVNDLNFLFCF